MGEARIRRALEAEGKPYRNGRWAPNPRKYHRMGRLRGATRPINTDPRSLRRNAQKLHVASRNLENPNIHNKRRALAAVIRIADQEIIYRNGREAKAGLVARRHLRSNAWRAV